MSLNVEDVKDKAIENCATYPNEGVYFPVACHGMICPLLSVNGFPIIAPYPNMKFQPLKEAIKKTLIFKKSAKAPLTPPSP